MASSSASCLSNTKPLTSKPSGAKCCFSGCGKTKRKFPQLHFFKFPVTRPNILEQWLVNCADESLISLTNKALCERKVCGNHFTPDCFTNNMKKYLKRDAVPTLLVCDNGEYVPGPPCSSTTITPSDQVGTNTTEADVVLNTNDNAEILLSPTHTLTVYCQSSPKTPSTPVYKKFKSIKNRTPTPSKKLITPTKRKLLNKLKDSQKNKKKFQTRAKRLAMSKKVLTKEELVEAMKDHFSTDVLNFFSMQLNHNGCQKKPWSEEERRLALSMNYDSPRFYDKMRRRGFALPSKSTIARWLQEIDLRPGICQDLTKVMAAKVESMSQWEKKSVILFDEMQIKTGLEYDSKRDVVEGVQDLGELGRTRQAGSKVLLFMARGLIHKWKMPFAYFIVNDSIKAGSVSEIVRMCVTALQNIGLDVKSVVCDQSSTNRGAAKKLGVSLKNPHFYCQEQKIYWIYDFPHIVKCIRNNLMKKNGQGHYVGKIESDEGVADWTHLTSLYDLDRSSMTARATKLTDKHINPNSFEKMSVKLATQVFSHSVSSAMKTAVEMHQLPAKANETAVFMQKMNNIFDAMNSRAKFDPNLHKCAISNSANAHLGMSLRTIENGISWVKTWRMLHSKQRPPSFVGMEHTMTTTMLLWRDLETEGVSYLLTARLNQDPLENEFSIARQRCGYNRNPTAGLFRQNLRHRIKCALLQPPTGSNCEPDEDDLIEVTSSSSSHLCPNTSSSAKPNAGNNIFKEGEEMEISCEDSAESESEVLDFFDKSLQTTVAGNKESLEACSVRYFVGYAARACLKKYKCQTCLDDLVQAQTSSSPDEALIRNRQYLTASGDSCESLISPTETTVIVGNATLQIIERMLIKNIHVVGARKKIVCKSKRKVFQEHREWMKCGSECYNHRVFFLLKLITAKLNCKLQEFSKDLRQPGGKYGGYYQKVKILEGH